MGNGSLLGRNVVTGLLDHVSASPVCPSAQSVAVLTNSRARHRFIENFQRKSASALSHWFILEWFSGDVTNLIGAFLTNQASTQVTSPLA